MVPTIFLSTFLLHFTVSLASEPQYVLWLPSAIQNNVTEKACLHLLNLNESVTLNVVFEYNGSNTTIFNQPVSEGNFYACANFKISREISEELGAVTLVVKGDTLKISERRSVALISEPRRTFVQTDKPIYKPGDNVRFRIVTLDPSLQSIEELYSLIAVQDPQNNKIFEWKNVTSFHNITQLSLPLISEPMLGDYSITVEGKAGNILASHYFTVNRQELPKFEVKVTIPETINILSNEFQVDTCAKYVYGEPVEGKAHIRVCRKNSSYWEENISETCDQFTIQLRKGCASQVVKTEVFQILNSELFRPLEVTVTVTESERGMKVTENSLITITDLLGFVNFKNMDFYYRRGLPYFGTLEFLNFSHVPLVNKSLQLEINGKFAGSYTTNENGEAQFSIDTSNISDSSLNLKATYDHPMNNYPNQSKPVYGEAYYTISRFYSRTNSFLKIVSEPNPLRCDQQKKVTVHYSLNGEAYEDNTDIRFFYLLMTKGSIFLNGQKEIKSKAWKGTFSLSVDITVDLAPVLVMLVYTLHPSGEMVADSVRFQLDKCFKNKVNVKFSKEQGLPGSEVSLSVQAAPGSFCALWAVDKGVHLLNPHQQLSAENVYNQLPYPEAYFYYYPDEFIDPCASQMDMAYNDSYYVTSVYNMDGDIHDIVRAMGLKVITSIHYRKPVVCAVEKRESFFEPLYANEKRYGFEAMSGGAASIGAPMMNFATGDRAMKETVRTEFPVTWIWDLITVDSSGSASLLSHIPDTITQWEASGFCVNGDAGFGISSTTSLKVSPSMFVDMTLPFSVVRNEQFDLIVTVFNYFNTCVEISVQLELSQNFETNTKNPVSNADEVIQAGEKKTYVWTLLPKTLGKVNITVVAESKKSSACPTETDEQQNLNWKDTLVKSLLVEPEGFEKEVTQSFFICTKGNKESRQVGLDLPSNVVEESARAFFTVVGDILGTAVKYLRNLLPMPYEFNQWTKIMNTDQLASDAVIFDYLISTKQLTEDIKPKIILSLSNGYQKQLTLKNPDGSYRLFWMTNQEGDIRYSALTWRTLEKIKEYVFIDEQVQKQTLSWLSSKQNTNGCFRDNSYPSDYNGEQLGLENGVPRNHSTSAKKDEDDSFISITASFVENLFEAGLSANFPAVQNGLLCLEETLEKNINVVSDHAILAYVFALAGKEKQVESLLQILDQSAIKTNNGIYWATEKSSSFFIPGVTFFDAEKTCYVLLTVVSKKTPDLTYASKIVQYLAQQMNSNGIFPFIQSNNVCLRAITHYMKLTYSDGQNNVIIHSENFSESFLVNNDNRLVVQRSEGIKPNGQYTVDVEGHGCVYIQVTQKYNVFLPKEAFGFSLFVDMVNKSSADTLPTSFDLTVTFNYTGINHKPKMVFVDVKMLSGFTPVISSIKKLEYSDPTMKTEVKNDHVLFYVQTIWETSRSITFSVEQSNLVLNIQPAYVIVSSYERDEYALATYNINNA